MPNHRGVIVGAVLAVGLAANAGALAAPNAPTASQSHRFIVYRPVQAAYRRVRAGAGVTADSGRAVQPQTPPAPDEPTVNLATGTARYDMGPTGLHDEAPTVGLVMKF